MHTLLGRLISEVYNIIPVDIIMSNVRMFRLGNLSLMRWPQQESPDMTSVLGKLTPFCHYIEMT